MSGSLNAGAAAAKDKFNKTKDTGDRLVNNLQRREAWLQFLTALNECLPHDSRPIAHVEPMRRNCASDIMHREQLLVTNVDSQPVEDVAKWFALVKNWYKEIPGQPGAPKLGEIPPGPPPPGGKPAAATEGPTGPGIIVQIYGRHFHDAHR